METRNDLTEKIVSEIVSKIGFLSRGHFQQVKEVLESYVEKPLPACPVCGGDLYIDHDRVGLGYWYTCAANCITGSIFDTKQEAIDAFWATPYGKMCKERDQ